MSLANFGEPATLVRSPTRMKTPGCCMNGCDPERRSGFVSIRLVRRTFGALTLCLALKGRVCAVCNLPFPRRHAFERLGNGRNVLGRVAAAAARDIDQPCSRKFAEVRAMSAGPRSNPVADSGFGNPAFG